MRMGREKKEWREVHALDTDPNVQRAVRILSRRRYYTTKLEVWQVLGHCCSGYFTTRIRGK